MDTFGRLPNDVLTMPIIDVVVEKYSTYLVVNYPNTEMKIDLKCYYYQDRSGYYVCDHNNLFKLSSFIENLKNNKNTYYEIYTRGMDRDLEIEVNDKITIKTPLNNIILNNHFFIAFIKAMEKLMKIYLFDKLYFIKNYKLKIFITFTW